MKHNTSPIAHLYIQSWIGKNNIEENVLKTEQELIKYKQGYTVINSTDNIYNKENWIDSGDHWYNVSLYNALKHFDGKADYFVFITGDVVVKSWKKTLDRMYSVLDNKIASYAPVSLVGDNQETYSKHFSSIRNIDKYLYCSVIQDGIFFAIRKDVALIVLDFFEYLSKNINLYDYKTGWGTDFAISTICLQEKLLMIKDSYYPAYNTSTETELSNLHAIANAERTKILGLLHSFYSEKGIDITDLVDKVKQRVGFLARPQIEPNLRLTFRNFYE